MQLSLLDGFLILGPRLAKNKPRWKEDKHWKKKPEKGRWKLSYNKTVPKDIEWPDQL